MCVYKSHAFICFGRPPSWSGTIIYTYITGNHSDITGIHYVHEYRIQCNCSAIPLLSAFPFLIPLLSPFFSLYLLGTLLAVIGACPPRSQVARKLISPFPSPPPYTPHSKILTPWGFPELNMHITKTTSRSWLPRSSTHSPLSKLPQHNNHIVLNLKYYNKTTTSSNKITTTSHSHSS